MHMQLISTTRLPHSPVILYDAAVLSGDKYLCLIGSINEMKHAGAHVGSSFATKLETILVAPAEMYGVIPVGMSTGVFVDYFCNWLPSIFPSARAHSRIGA
jgi:hypothetical protein